MSEYRSFKRVWTVRCCVPDCIWCEEYETRDEGNRKAIDHAKTEKHLEVNYALNYTLIWDHKRLES